MMITELLARALVKRKTWHEASQHHREIKKLSSHLLEDIGLNRIDSSYEVKYLLWDLRKKDNSSAQHHNYPARASHLRICAFGKCIKY